MSNNTPTELTGGVTAGGTTSGGPTMSVNQAAALLADALNISQTAAAAQIRAYMTQNNVDPRQAGVALSHGQTVDPSNNTPSETGGGSSGSGGSSSGGSSGPSAADLQKQKQNAEASYLNMLVGWGIMVTPEVKSFVSKSVAAGDQSSLFLQKLRQTKFYAKRFPGIVKKNGVMRMSEAQYISGYQQARDYASTLGRNFSPQAYGAALAAGNSPSEIKYKLDINDKLQTYRPQLNSFNEYLLATGKIKKPLDVQEMRDFVMGSRKDLQDEWATSNAAFQLQEQAGTDVGKPAQGSDMSFKELSAALKRYEALGGDVDQIDYTKIGSLIGQVIPKNELYGAGIRKKDIVDMMLNGKNASEITKRVQTVLDTYEAAVTEPGAQSQNQQGRVYQNVRPRPVGE